VPRLLRRLLIAIAVLVGIAVTAFAALVWLIAVPHTPDLTPAKAAETISARPEFNQTKLLIVVSSTTRAHGSLKDNLYTAKFTFRLRGSPTPVKANAEFGYWKGGWHLREFYWGEPASEQTVVSIQSDVPQE
jgi:uncharacterized membrane protein